MSSLRALWLAAASVLMTAELTAAYLSEVILCNAPGNVLHLNCELGTIGVWLMQYGSASGVCDGRTANIMDPSYMICTTTPNLEFRNRCHGQTSCEINVNELRTEDPCFSTHHYLSVVYACGAASASAPFVALACENSIAKIECGVGKIIRIRKSFFGRKDPTTCSYNRPASQVENTNCVTPFSWCKVLSRCHGKSSCSLEAYTTLFGDHCFGTYKYLEVKYTCVDA